MRVAEGFRSSALADISTSAILIATTGFTNGLAPVLAAPVKIIERLFFAALAADFPSWR
jgi:hypothetical protein